jgi:hypothetical protein
MLDIARISGSALPVRSNRNFDRHSSSTPLFREELQQAFGQQSGGLPEDLPPVDASVVNQLASVVRQAVTQAQGAWGNPSMGAALLGNYGGGDVRAGSAPGLAQLTDAERAFLAASMTRFTGVGDESSATGTMGLQPADTAWRMPERQCRQVPGTTDATNGEVRYAPLIQKAARTYGLDESLLRAVVRVESGFNAHAVSPAGAQGLMQLMPGTARDLGVTDPFDPEQNIMAGAKYLRQLLDRYRGERDLALAAYNWGMGNVERRPQAMPEETRHYVVKVNTLLRSATA